MFPGDTLRRLREERGLSRAQLAARCGADPAGVAAWESGAAEPLWSAVVAAAAALNVSVLAFNPPAKDAAEGGSAIRAGLPGPE